MNPALPDGPLYRPGQPGAGTAVSERHTGTRQIGAAVIGPGVLTTPSP